VAVFALAALLPARVAGQACVPTVTVSTLPELRAAVADPCVTTVLVSPGLYDLSSDGGGELAVTQSKAIRNTGGGETVLDAGGASRVIAVGTAITVEIANLTVRGGAEARGAGIFTAADQLTVRGTTIEGNAGTRGGGILHQGGLLLVENSTVSGNSASQEGGGMELRDGATLVHVTVARNTAGRGGGLRARAGVVLANTLVAENASGDGAQIRGAVTSLGGNLVVGGCTGCGPTDLTGDPLLLPLTLNGGDTRTHALDGASIAIDAADPASGLPFDQRGAPRPAGPGFDIGAYEAPAAFSVFVTAAAAAQNRLPSNGTAYAEAFTVLNTGLSASAFTLLASSAGTAVTVDSVRGPGVTFGVRPDSAATPIVASGAVQPVSVFYTVPDVPAGSSAPVALTASVAAFPTVSDADTTAVTVVRPFLGMTKLASVAGDTVPGAPVTYQVTVTNLGTEAAAEVEVLDSLPALVDFVVGSTSETLPAGITASLAFDDGSDAWTYAPVSGGCGADAGRDRCVRAIRWLLATPLPAVAPDNVAVFRFTAGIR
jgi:uncharacterized repeat protein (TIGR01451 family)